MQQESWGGLYQGKPVIERNYTFLELTVFLRLELHSIKRFIIRILLP